MVTTGLYPPAIRSSGVINDPPPTPVRPMRMPTANPKKTIRGSMGAGNLRGRRRLGGGFVRARHGLERLLARRKLARHDLRDPVAAHAHAVEHVGRVHCPLLVRDDDELGPVRVPVDEAEEPVYVEIVQRRLDLVEDVERARPSQEYGKHEGERDERLLAA